MRITRITTGIGLLAVTLTAPLAAQAQPFGEAGVARVGPAPRSGYGIDIKGGGGYANFTGSTARGVTSGAGTWNVRATFGTRLPIGFEAAYNGMAQSVDAIGVDNDAYLIGNGLEAAARLAWPTLLPNDWIVTPFATAGLGWMYYSLEDAGVNTSFLRQDDNVWSIPLALGVNGTYRGFTADARFTYRPTFDDDLFGGSNMSTWGLGVNLGYEF